METQMRYRCAQIQTMNATSQDIKRIAEPSWGTFDKLFREKEAALIRARKTTPKPT